MGGQLYDAGILYLGLTAQPSSTVVLMPQADGRVGAVELHTAAANQSLHTAYARATSNSRGAFITQTVNVEFVNQRYGQTLAALPAIPMSFVLMFESGAAVDIAPAFAPVWEQLRAALPNYPAPEITVIGHTDRVGSQEANDRLSLQRAQSVRDWMVQAGVDPSSITIAGRGEREPAVATQDEMPMAENRGGGINLR